MLSAIRGTLGSFVVLTLLGLLIASFALWGIPDLFSNTGGRAVVTIGDQEIDVVEFDRAYGQRLRQMEAQFGQVIDREQAAAIGIPQQVLQQLVSERSFNMHAKELGLRGSNRQVVTTIHEVEAFEGFDGRFDRTAYENQLAQAGVTPGEFETSLRNDLMRRQLVEALVAAKPAPDTLAESLFRYRNESRKATILSVSAQEVGTIDLPTEDELRAAFEVEKGRFMTPAYKMVAVAEISPASVAKPDEVTDEELEEGYAARLAEFQTPELRDVDLVSFGVNDKELAETFVSRIEAGEPFDTVLSDMTDFQPDEIALGDMSHSDIEQDYNTKVADAVFALTEPGLSAPAQSVFGWHIFRVRGITEPVNRPLDQVANILRQEIAEEKALDAVYDVSVEAEEMLARGAGLQEIATNLQLVFEQATVSREGLLQTGGVVQGAISRHLSDVWALEIDEPVMLEPTDDGGFTLMDVTDEIPPQQRPFIEVQDQLRENLIAERQLAKAGEKAEELAQSLRSGEPIATLAETAGADLLETDWITRSGIGRSNQVAPIVGRLMFQMAVGDVAVERAASGDGYVVVRLDDKKPGNPQTDAAEYEALLDSLGTAMLNDALVQYESALRKDYGVEVNTNLLQQVINPQGAL